MPRKTPIVIEFDDRQVLDVLQSLGKRVDDLQPVMADIGEYLINSTKGRFGTGIAPSGTPWLPDTPATLSRKRGSKPLIGESKELSRNFSYDAKRDGLVFGSSVVYAAVQQFGARKGAFGRNKRGAPIPWGDIPARPFIGFSTRDTDQVLDIVREFLTSIGD